MDSGGLKLAIVGATGLVVRTMLLVLQEQAISLQDLIPMASPRSAGSKISFSGQDYRVSCPEDGLWRGADAALLSPGAAVSRIWVPRLAQEGITCIDNSSAFRLSDDVPLIVPEVNPDDIRAQDRIIANPNCSTIQLVVALAPLHREFGLMELVVSTYQSASGAGQKGKRRLLAELSETELPDSPFP
ncbi:MAG: Asd/ArgC dimerization domain-containing protein, partial [bacterium]